MNHQKPTGRFLCKQSSLQVQEKNFEDYDHIKGSPLSPKNDSTANSFNGSKDLGSFASKQEFTSFSTAISSQFNIRTKAFDVCPFCYQSKLIELILEISDVETTLYCESLNFNDLGMFYYHSDCWKDGVLLSPDHLNTILQADLEFKGDNLLPKLKGEINEDALISIKIYHPLSTVLIGKILINDALQEKKDKVTLDFIQLIILTYDFKADSVLYQVGTLFLPLCFLRLGVSLHYKDETEIKKIDNEFLLNVVTECVNRNVEISFVPSF